MVDSSVRSADNIASRLRELADRLEAEWPSVPSTADLSARHSRIRFANLSAVAAGKTLIEAAQVGLLDDDGKTGVERVSARKLYQDKRNWEHNVFLYVVHHWLPRRAPGYGGPSITYPDVALELPGKHLLGIKYARNMRAIADVICPLLPRDDWEGPLPPKAWQKRFEVCARTWSRMIKDKVFRIGPGSTSRRVRIHRDDVQRFEKK